MEATAQINDDVIYEVTPTGDIISNINPRGGTWLVLAVGENHGGEADFYVTRVE